MISTKTSKTNCSQTQSVLSDYVDTALAGSQMQAVREHLRGCAECNAEHHSLEQTRALVAGLGTRRAPADLALRIRSAISRERAEQQRRSWLGMLVRVEEGVRSFMLPATAGLVSAIVFFGVLIGFVRLIGLVGIIVGRGSYSSGFWTLWGSGRPSPSRCNRKFDQKVSQKRSKIAVVFYRRNWKSSLA